MKRTAPVKSERGRLSRCWADLALEEALPRTRRSIVTSRTDGDEWHDVGEVSVDSGHLWVGDPCYILDSAKPRGRDLGQSWDDIVKKMVSSDAVQWTFDAGTPGFGVTVVAGLGDGTYPVRIKRTASGDVAAVLIEFIGDDEPEEAP
jgi:hypothetical protein